MSTSSNQILILVAVLASLPIVLGIRRRREAILRKLRMVIIVECVYLGVVFIMIRSGQPPIESVLAGLVAMLFVTL
jgi:hypothetical protein